MTQPLPPPDHPDIQALLDTQLPQALRDLGLDPAGTEVTVLEPRIVTDHDRPDH